MKKTRDIENDNLDLDALFERYRRAPDSHAFVPLADACRKSGQIEEALEICNRGVERHPDYPSGHVVRGKCLFDQGDRRSARGAFERVLALDDGNLVARKYLGIIEADWGNLDEARRHLQQILAVDPENKEVMDVLRDVEERGQVQTGKGESSTVLPDEVEEVLGTAESPGDAPAATERTERVGADTRAGDTLETSEELASITLADIFASQGYTSKAEKIYREVLRKQPDNEFVQKRLLELSGEGGGSDTPDGDSDAPDYLDDPFEMEDLSDDVEAAEPDKADTTDTNDEPLASPAPDDDEHRVVSKRDSINHFQRWLDSIQN